MNSQARFVWEGLDLRTPVMLRIVEPLSEGQIRWVPPNGSNSIAWLLWHIAEVEDNWVRDRVYGQPRRYPFGTPMREATLDRYPSKATLLEYFFEVRALSRQRLEQTSENDFDRLVDDFTWGRMSVRQVWAGVVTSCAWHGGQIALTNRLIPRNANDTDAKERWVAIFDDNEGQDWIRKEHSAAHFEFLKANQDKIVIAGGLRPAPSNWYCGGLWVLEVDSRDEAVELIGQDPYFRLGLRKHYRLLAWGKAPCYSTVNL